MSFMQGFETRLDNKTVDSINKEKTFYHALNICSELTGKNFLIEGIPKKDVNFKNIPYNVKIVELINTVLDVYGYLPVYSKDILCLKLYDKESIVLQNGEISKSLLHMIKMLKKRDYYPKSPGEIDEDYKNLFNSLNLQHKDILLASIKPSPQNTEDLKKFLNGLKKSPLSKDFNPTDTSVSVSLNMLSALQFNSLSRCTNNDEINKLMFNVQRGVDTFLRTANANSRFLYTEKRFFTSLINQRIFEGKLYATTISPVSRVELNFTSSSYSETPLTEPDFSDPSREDYNPDGTIKSQFFEDDRFNFIVSDLIKKSFGVEKVSSGCGLENKAICVIGPGKVDVATVEEFLKKAFNYIVINNEKEAIVDFPKYNRSMLKSSLKEFIDYYSLASVRRFYENIIKKNVYSDNGGRINDSIFLNSINDLKESKIKQFRIVFDAFVKQSGKKVVSWNELPESCKNDITTVFCIEAFTALEKMRMVNSFEIPRRGTVQFMLRKSYANYFLTFQILSPEGKILKTNSGIIAKDSPEKTNK